MRPSFVLSVIALVALSACGAEPVWAPDAAVAQAHFVTGEPPSITLYTVINNRTEAGAHSGLMINGVERIMFDPAGTWHHPKVPERNDVHYGITPKIEAFYVDYHARETYRVVKQTLPVSLATAELIAQRAKEYGAVPKAMCANSVSTILSNVPGLEGIHHTFFPNKLMEEFGELPGVVSRTITDDDADKNHGVLLVQAGEGPA